MTRLAVQLPLFKGVAIDDSVGAFVGKYGLSAEAATALRRQVGRSLQAKGLAPLIEFSFQVRASECAVYVYRNPLLRMAR